jgi:retron-type reverse transcriptase
LAENVAKLRADIQRDSYRFSKLRMAPILKPSGGHRIIAIPTIRDRLLQRALLAHLEADKRFNVTSPISFGFTKHRTLADAQRRALELRQLHPWVLKADIVKFFDQIQRGQIKELVRKRVRSKVIAGLLCDAIDCELEDRGGLGAEIARTNGIRKGLGLRQGMPVSPLLSNLLLKGFDDSLAKQGIQAVRYADDIAVFADSKNDCQNALTFIRSCLGPLKLKVPELMDDSKTTVSEPSKAVEFLGVEIKLFGDIYRLCAPSKKIAKIEADMAAICSVEQCVKDQMNIGRVVRTLESLIIGHRASMAVLDNPNDFILRLEAAKERSLRALLISLIGKNAVRELDHDRLAILGLEDFNH